MSKHMCVSYLRMNRGSQPQSVSASLSKRYESSLTNPDYSMMSYDESGRTVQYNMRSVPLIVSQGDYSPLSNPKFLMVSYGIF